MSSARRRKIGIPAAVADLPVAHPAEQGLGVMAEIRDKPELHEPGGPLDGVEGPKDPAHRLGVVGVMLKGEQGLLRALDEFGALGDELGQIRSGSAFDGM
jgi:hypothetical protein